MKVAITGATGVIGTSTVCALVASGCEVVGLARTPEKAAVLEQLGAEAASTSLFDRDGLIEVFRGCDAVCNFATHVPVGYGTVWPGSWREHDRLRTEGVRRVLDAAREGGVRRVVQESASSIYVGNGDAWITEDSPIGINQATEPASVGESHVQQFQCGSRHGVVLRFGAMVGNDALTRRSLTPLGHGRPVAIGSPGSWAHVVHTDDLGTAAVAALDAPSGVYNVGAEPVLWEDYGQAFARGRQDPHRFPRSTLPSSRRVSGRAVDPIPASELRPLHGAVGLVAATPDLRRVLVRRRHRPVPGVPVSPPAPTGGQEDDTGDADRKRKLAEVFEDALPEGTQDERAEEWGEREDGDARDAWLRGEVPPHHG